MKTISLDAALRAQKALRDAAGLPPEIFPVEAFVGMISDEIEALRKQGKSDDEIARVISDSAETSVSASEIDQYYAPPEARHPPEE